MAEKVVCEAYVENGPSPSSFVDGLLGPDIQNAITFTLEGRNTVTVQLDQIQREDGSGKSFNFWGYNTSTQKKVRGFFLLCCHPVPSLPILYSAHHCSANFGAFAHRTGLSEEQRKRLSDIGTDRTAPLHGKVFVATHSRGVVDLNRSLTHIDLFRDVDFADPPHRIWNPWQEPTAGEQDDILQQIYQPYHEKLLQCLQELSKERQPIIVVAWDNMGRYPLRDDGSHRPGHTVPIILSNCGQEESADRTTWQTENTSCHPSLLSTLAEEFRHSLVACGFLSNIADGIHFNLPGFTGGYICKHYTKWRHPTLPVSADVQSLQVEYDITLTHNPHTLEANDDAIARLQQAFSVAMEQTYQRHLRKVLVCR